MVAYSRSLWGHLVHLTQGPVTGKLLAVVQNGGVILDSVTPGIYAWDIFCSCGGLFFFFFFLMGGTVHLFQNWCDGTFMLCFSFHVYRFQHADLQATWTSCS